MDSTKPGSYRPGWPITTCGEHRVIVIVKHLDVLAQWLVAAAIARHADC